MGHQFNWYDQARGIIRIDVEKPATWEGHRNVIELTALEIERTPLDRLDVILVNNAPFPPGNAVPHFRWTIKRLLPYYRLGMFVIVDPSPQLRVTQVLISSITQIARINSKKISAVVPTFAEALDIIEEDRATRVKSIR
jgi:hypothetical protein